MPQFFVPSHDISEGLCRIQGEDYHHLARVHRVKAGEVIRCITDNNRCFTARVTKIGPTDLEAEVLEELDRGGGAELTLWIALLKGKTFDFVIQKGVELGIRRIVPVITERTVLRKREFSLERWRKIALEAVKQSMGPALPEIDEPMAFRNAVEAPSGLRILAHPGTEHSLREALAEGGPGEAHLLIGPEGGFTGGEVSLAASLGWKPANFGFTSLRAETAAIVIAALALYEMGE